MEKHTSLPPLPISETKMLPLSVIRRDFQSDKDMNKETVSEYILDMEDQNFEPVNVFFDGETCFLADGFHRFEAALQSGHEEILANIIFGTYDDMEKRAQLEHEESMRAVAEWVTNNPESPWENQ